MGIFLCEKNGQTLTVLNYGKYIDESVVKQFEKETGITVKYEEYESPEEMYTKYKAGSINYDVICSSEYMVERLINEGEVLEEDYDAMDNYKIWIQRSLICLLPMTRITLTPFHILRDSWPSLQQNNH